MAGESKSSDVGTFIRRNVIPTGMSVKDAAKRLNVGRPALSNLLNGNAALSPEMALRLERAFGADRQKLLELQAGSDRDDRSKSPSVAVGRYVPNFLTIKAKQIDEWAGRNLEARQHLAVLLRKLVHSTGHDLHSVDFPGHDNAERKGWDGLTEAGAATPWIPEGRSCWEFGTNQNPGAKAEKDYAARMKTVSAAERAACTFVFVTPRNWPGKTEWAKGKNASGDWKAVKALDASDIEQWLEMSIPAQIWLAEKLGLPVRGFRTLDQCWECWAAASDPQMTPEIFDPSITAHRSAFKEWLEKPSERAFVIAADSKDEALAFLACLFRDGEIARRAGDLAAVFESAETLRTLAASSAPFIPIVSTQDGERELASVYRRLHSLIVRPRNAVDSEPNIALDLLGHQAFEKALKSMGIEGDEVDRLARDSGRSPTILRRRLSKIDAIRTPQWASDPDIARSLIPITFIGAWHAKSNADRDIVSTLADRPYQEIEEIVTRLLPLDDGPVWSAGQYRGVASKIDGLFAINKAVTEKDLTDFLEFAEYVLSEADPALDLPEDQRWAAGIYGKVRDHSAALRQGICETLVILSVHGNNLFRDRIGIDVEARVSLLIRRLLTPMTLQKLMSHNNDLPRYAEAAPDEFLRILEEDLGQPEPAILGLLKPAGSGIFGGGCPRSGLLWALECLAWKPQTFARVSLLLAQLSRTKIDDNWMNKPIASLGAIYRSWMPQTAAAPEERVKSLEMLTKRFPDVAWQICIDQFDPGSRMGDHSYRPHWRSDASGAGQVVTRKEVYEFARKALDLALAWPKHDENTLGDLVERLDGMADEDQAALWDMIDSWAAATVDDNVKATLRECIRRFAFTRRGRMRGLKQATRDRAREAYAKLEPRDPVIRHAWLFANQWVEESPDEMEDEDLDYSKREERIQRLRAEAMKEIWAERSFDGITALLSRSGAPHTVGWFAAACVPDSAAAVAFLKKCLSVGGELERKLDGCMQGFLLLVDAGIRSAVLAEAAEDASAGRIARLFRCAPFGDETWRLLDGQDKEVRDQYWRDVVPTWNRHTDAERIELVDRLLDARRPRAAFHAVHMDWDKVEASQLKRLLQAVATVGAEPQDSFKLDAYHISEALESLDGRAGVSPDEMAQLEFMFLSALDRSEHGIPNLERQIAESPAAYVQALALAYKRSDSGQDPPEWCIDDPEKRDAVISAIHRLLHQLTRIPGTDCDGKVNAEALQRWLTEVRRLCAQSARVDIGDHKIGELLSHAPADEDGVRPCIAVCEAMERIGSQRISEGFQIGIRNARGAHWRGEGGAQERGLADQYRSWAQRRAFDYPYVSSVLEAIAASYDREAEWHDSDAKVNKRLRH